MDSIVDVQISVKKLRNVNLLITVDNAHHPRNLLPRISFVNIAYKCYQHQTPQEGYYCLDLAGVIETRDVENIQDHNVTAVRHIKIIRHNSELLTNTIILTCCTAILPRSLNIFFLLTKVDIYVPILFSVTNVAHVDTMRLIAKLITCVTFVLIQTVKLLLQVQVILAPINHISSLYIPTSNKPPLAELDYLLRSTTSKTFNNFK